MCIRDRQEYYCKLAVVGPIKWKLCWLQSILVKEAGFEPGFRTGIFIYIAYTNTSKMGAARTYQVELRYFFNHFSWHTEPIICHLDL